MYIIRINKAKYEYEMHSLTKAFYPEEDVRVLSPESAEIGRASCRDRVLSHV